MGIALVMHESEAFKQLLEEVASGGLRETTTKSNEVEKLTSADELKHDELDVLAALLGVALKALVDFDEADDVAVLQVCKGRHLSVDQLLEGLVGVDDLDGVALACAVLG